MNVEEQNQSNYRANQKRKRNNHPMKIKSKTNRSNTLQLLANQFNVLSFLTSID